MTIRHENRVGARQSYQTDTEQKQKEKKENEWYEKEQKVKERNVRFILRIQLNDNQIRLIWEIVRVAVPRVPRSRASEGAVC